MKWMMCLGVVAMLVGCDASKDELESTKTTLASVTKERDDLKTQVGALQQQLDASKADLAKAKAAPQAGTSTATKTPAPDAKDAGKGKHAHKS
jgi:hypothetical protein